MWLLLPLQTFGEFLEPIAHVHFNVEGTIEFTAMMFVPGMAPFEQQNWAAKSKSIKLYVRRVFISDEFDEDLMPRRVCAAGWLCKSHCQADCRLDLAHQCLLRAHDYNDIPSGPPSNPVTP
jgi:hypothetical protein